ncbi:DUF3054 domain-containing protein [Streptomonospora nanhaiensis]|uniref:DUF3054 domain-containing protein n=1 Tax=Streptomonospora nanhaiensis TaxID=1323731 RepID=UPI001C99B4A4|nr:DUF3054 domain-containing protein [Streptomonospora nanhaiensis]MBX9388766.1 DUF3054 domain-containing protein [Streptomonospora nanhaiensis]
MRSPVTALVLDVLCVLAFVLIGRANHAEGLAPAGVAATAWPFLAALAAAWLLCLAWRRPAAPVPTGVVVWLVTVAGGMALRAAAGGGVQVSFVVVAAVFLGLVLVGWRALALLRRPRHGAAEG